MQQVVLLGRQKREDVQDRPAHAARARLTVVTRDAGLLAEMQTLDAYVADELNVREVCYSEDEAAFIEVIAKPNFQLLGKRLGKQMKAYQELPSAGSLATSISGASEPTVRSISTARRSALRRSRCCSRRGDGTNTVSNSKIAVDLDCTLTADLIRGGLAREIVNRVQRARKELGLEVSDRIEVVYAAEGDVAEAASVHMDYVAGEVLALKFVPGDPGSRARVADIGDTTFAFKITKAEPA